MQVNDVDQYKDITVTPSELSEFEKMLDKAEINDLVIECEPERIVETITITKHITDEEKGIDVKKSINFKVWDITSDVYLMICLTAGLSFESSPSKILEFACKVFKTDEVVYCVKRSKYFLMIDDLSEIEYEIICAILNLHRKLFNARIRQTKRKYSCEHFIASEVINDFNLLRRFKTEEFKRDHFTQRYIEKYGCNEDPGIKFKTDLPKTDIEDSIPDLTEKEREALENELDRDAESLFDVSTLTNNEYNQFVNKVYINVERKIDNLIPSVLINGCSWFASKRLNDFFIANLPLAVNSSMETTTEAMEAICKAIGSIKNKSETFESIFNKPFDPTYANKGFYGPSLSYCPDLLPSFIEDLPDEDDAIRMATLDAMKTHKVYGVLDMLGMVNDHIMVFLVSSRLEDDNRYLIVVNQADRRDFLVLDL